MLSPADVKFYQDQGYLVVPDVLDAATLANIRAELARLLDGARAVTTHTDRYDLEPGHRPDEPRVRRIKQPHRFYPVFQDLMRHPRLLAVLQGLLGRDVRLHGSKINLKSPRYGSPVEWHQDWAFYPHTNDDLLAVGVMLDDTTLENGAMYIIPGSHKGPTYNHHDPEGYFCGAMDIEAAGIDLSKKVACEGPAGSCSFHHVRMVHGSAQNTSSKSRGLLLYEMGAADAYPLIAVGKFGWDALHERMVYGEDTIEPRMREAPIRMPYPPARGQGSIYESQTRVGKRYFDMKEPAKV